MKLELPCTGCIFNGGEPLVHPHTFQTLPLNDTCIYEVCCPNGHKALIHLQAFKYEMLFESGVKALRDGYNREAVTSFAVSLERFYEFSIGILLIDKLGVMSTSKIDERALINYEKLWKMPLKLSERQLGAFYGLYFNEFEEAPLLFDEAFSKKLKHKVVTNPVNFRNRVIHEGYIPTHEEAIEYGEAVHSYINALAEVYREKDKGRKLSRAYFMTWLELAISFKKRGEVPRHIPGIGFSRLLSVHSLPSQSFAEYVNTASIFEDTQHTLNGGIDNDAPKITNVLILAN